MDNIVESYLEKQNMKRKKKLTQESLDIVGVHVRRTDHIRYEDNLGYQRLTSRYFIQAMDSYLENLPHPIFVVVSDDLRWCKQNLKLGNFPISYSG